VGFGHRAAFRIVAACVVCIALTQQDLAQSILTFAGGGTDDGRPATIAGLDRPASVISDAAGNIYISDSGNHRIRKVSASTGIITTIAGNGTAGFTGDGGPAAQAALSDPRGIALDAAGNLYIADEGNRRIRRVEAGTSIITTYAGSGSYGSGGDGGLATTASFRLLSGLAIAPSGDLYAVDSASNNVRKIASVSRLIATVAGTGTWGFSGDGGPATAANLALSGDTPSIILLSSPPSLAFDSSSNLYLSDTFNHRVRRITPAGIITTIAGNGTNGFSGDGGAALNASLGEPGGLAIDSANNLYIADPLNHRIRRMSLTSNIVTTAAGNGFGTFAGDGGPAAAASLTGPYGVAAAPNNDLLIADTFNSRIRRVSAATSIINTIAGNGVRFSGDGGPATSGVIYQPAAMVFDAAGSMIVSEYNGSRIRKIARDGRISTIAGTGVYGSSSAALGDGGPATSATMSYPGGVAIDNAGNIYFADIAANRIRRITGGFIATVIGSGSRGFSGDGGPATSAQLNMASASSSSIFVGYPSGIAISSAGDLYFSDTFNHRIRKVAAGSQIISTIAGTTEGFSGDGGPATAAQLDRPTGLALDRNLLYVADTLNNRIRRIDLGTGTITTIAGSGDTGQSAGIRYGGDNGPATQAFLGNPTGVSADINGNFYIADKLNNRIRKVSGGTITTVAGYGTSGFAGDGGPAVSAGLSTPYGVLITSAGDLLIADSSANRVRSVLSCVNVSAPSLSQPAANAIVSVAPTLSWNAVQGAFRYDVYASTANPPALIAGDVTATAFTLANLAAGNVYYWRIVAKGDPFCAPASISTSEVRSFTTAQECVAPSPPNPSQPQDNATNVPRTVELSWQSGSGVSTYDLYFGPTDPPPLLAGNLSSNSYTVSSLTPNTQYFWFVIAHAGCDSTKTSSGSKRAFRTEGGCLAPSGFNAIAPQNGATDVALSATFTWSASSNASSYDLYLGASAQPPLYLRDLQKTAITVTGLLPSTNYSWRVVAKAACDASKNVSTSTATFTTGRPCLVPAAPSIKFVPPGNVGVGQTYTIAWGELPDLDASAYYTVERSLSSSFTSIVDSQDTYSTSASFVSTSAATYYHRVRAVAGCDPRPGPPSEAKPVTVVTGSPNVIFTVQPQAVITSLGEKLEDRHGTFTLENIGTDSLQVILGKGEINSVPFFAISDPLGGDSVFVTLEPKKPRTFQINFSGPANDRTSAYQGIIFVASTGQGLAITPYAFVNLKVGGASTSRPVFVVNGQQSEYAYFPGYAGPDEARPPVTISIRNSGSSPMELGAEIGPEVWLVPEAGWNSSAIAGGAARDVKLSTQRSRAPNKSALPRYTYLTVRSKNGESARLLVQDNDAPATNSGRTSLLDPGSRSFIVPLVTSSDVSSSRIRLTNVGSDPVQADLYFTPEGLDGFDSNLVKRASIIVPPNDVVNLTDPLLQIFALARPSRGQLEIRASGQKVGSLIVSSSVITPSRNGGSYGYDIPVYLLGEGARLGSPLSAAGIVSNAATRATVILAETTGNDAASVHLTLYEGNGSKRSETSVTVPRYGEKSIDLATMTGGAAIDGARIDASIESGGGAIAVVITLVDAATGSGAAAGTPVTFSTTSSRALAKARFGNGASTVSAVVPVAVNGPVPGSPETLRRTLLALVTTGRAQLTANVTYRPKGAAAIAKTLTLVPGVVQQFDNVLEQFFGIPAGQSSEGSIFVDAAEAQIYARLMTSTSGGAWTVAGHLPIIPTVSDLLTSVKAHRPLYLDGLEQSIDPARGTRWQVILDEISGSSGSVTVRLYEAGNRSFAIAEKSMSIGAYEQIRLDTVFSALGLDTTERRKDRANVLAVVTADGGNATVSAVGVRTDNVTGETQHSIFSPSGGVPATGVTRVSQVTPVSTPPPAAAQRRRAVKP